MMLLLVFLFIFIQCTLISGQAVVNTTYGPINGSIECTKTGKLYYSFKGIPYAKPPIGNLRFKAPQPPDQWINVRDATKDGPVCIQKNYLFANPIVEGQEDCLYLNVYTSADDIENQTKLLPVMVFIHWGGFFAGRGTSDYLGPEYFMEQDVVLVTFNYRLGVFGFLTTLDDAAPGNYAFKDQVAVLRWVQNNIHNFGGSKSMVTIFGQSAGAASVHYHMLSPLSKGLFRAGISQSGTALALWASPANPIQVNILAAQAEFVKCGNYTRNSTRLIECLRNVSAKELIESQDFFKTFFVDPLTVYTPVTEKLSVTNPEPFITKSPTEYIQAKDFTPVPWIIGVVQDEGLLKAEPILRNTEIRNQLNNNFNVVLSDLMYFSSSAVDPQSLYDNVTEHYLQKSNYINVSDVQSIQGFIDLYSDRAFLYSTYQSAVLHAIKGHPKIWVYNFNYRGLYSYGDLFAGTNANINFEWGVSHCDDLLYLFNASGLFPPLVNKTDVSLSHLMIKMWINFAIYGNPNPSENRVLDCKWNPLEIKEDDANKNDKFCFLNLTGSYHDESVGISTQCGFNKERIHFWTRQSLFENVDGIN